MLFDKIKKKSTAKHIVALDIGTVNVKALIGRIKGDNIEIIGVGRAKQSLSDMEAGAVADIGSVVDNCDKALGEAEKMAGVNARNTVIGIAGELVKGTTTTIRFRRAKPEEPITMEEMEHIIERIQAKAQTKAMQILRLELGNKDVDARLVNSALVSMEIDGYKVSNPISFQGKVVSVQLYTAFAPMIHIGALERVAQELDMDLLAVSAEPFAVARSVIGTDASSNFTAVLVDVGGGTTDIAVVNDGGVEGTKMYGIGGRSFTRSISHDMNLDFDKAEQMKMSYSQAKLEDDEAAKVGKPIERTLEVWMSGLELALEEFSHLDHLPNKVLFCGGGSSLPDLIDALKHKSWYKNLPFAKTPHIQHLEPKQVSGVIDKTGTIHDHTYITAMGLLRVGADTLESDSSDDGFQDKLNKILSV